MDRYTAVVLDVDGCLIRGHAAIPGAAATLAALRARGTGVALATNNSSRSPADVVGWLASAGVAAEPDMVVTSSQAAARMLRGDEAVLAVGSAALRAELTAVGARLVDDPLQADTVVVGIDTELRYATLRDATTALTRGARFIATNMDPSLPTADGVSPGNGAIVAALRVASAREPEVAGKPGSALIEAAVATMADPSGPVLVVGDRVDTDIAAGAAAGCDTALVLTGVTSREAARDADPAPTWVLDDVAALLRPPPTGR